MGAVRTLAKQRDRRLDGFANPQVRLTFRSSNKPNLSWSSTSRQLKPLSSKSRRRCSSAPTRWLN